jgi:hypothetical protein
MLLLEKVNEETNRDWERGTKFLKQSKSRFVYSVMSLSCRYNACSGWAVDMVSSSLGKSSLPDLFRDWTPVPDLSLCVYLLLSQGTGHGIQ